MIVCEGGKTEPNYLYGLCRVHRLSNANIRVTSANGTDPMTIVAFAETVAANEDFDRIYCVFDRDQHATYAAALARVAQLPEFTAITSVPCFEVWLSLHFGYSSAPKTAVQALADLKRVYPSYRKGCKTVFDDLSPKLIDAVSNAKHLTRENQDTGSTNPATLVHELVEYLIGLKADGIS